MTAGAVTSGASDVPGRPSHYRFPRQATAKSIHYWDNETIEGGCCFNWMGCRCIRGVGCVTAKLVW